ISSVDIDNSATAAAAANYLIERGHTRIGFIAAGHKSISSRERAEGYRQAMIDARLEPRPEWVFFRWDLRDQWPHSLVDAFLAMPLADRPTAFVGWNDVLASQFVAALASRGISVPKDVSVISIDYGPEASKSI